jgi:raffinose/stachyose/melibiose transport system substrate-binding protein
MHMLGHHARLVVGVAAMAAVALTAGACSASSPSASSKASGSASAATGGGDADKGNLTYWYWGESDAPGANNWMKARISEYEKSNPGVKINLVLQSSDTLIGAFTTAAQTKSGPDIATQWATIPVLSQAWAGAVAPISDYVTAAQRANWIGTQENTDQGKVYAVPLYVIGIPLAYNKTLFAKAGLTEPPKTFADLLTDCTKLKAVGVTPIGMGNKDGYFGAWFFSNFGKQNLDSTDELKQAIIGKADITDPKYTGLYDPMHQLKANGCLNDDIASLTLDQGMAKFGSGQAAMAWGTDGIVNNWAKQLGADKVGITTTPTWGTGKLASVYNTTQSSSAFITSWSQHKAAAAKFLTWLHEPANLTSWYQATGIFPADKQFQPSSIKDDLGKQMWQLDSSDGAVWLENFLPPSVDGDGDLAAGQVITSGGSVEEAVDTFRKAVEKWRTQNPAEVKNYTTWAGQ